MWLRTQDLSISMQVGMLLGDIEVLSALNYVHQNLSKYPVGSPVWALSKTSYIIHSTSPSCGMNRVTTRNNWYSWTPMATRASMNYQYHFHPACMTTIVSVRTPHNLSAVLWNCCYYLMYIHHCLMDYPSTHCVTTVKPPNKGCIKLLCPL